MAKSVEELQGIVEGLLSVVKDLSKNVSQVNQTVSDMAQLAPTASQHSDTQSLRMPSIQLPAFRRDSAVQDDISDFLECFTQQMSNLPAETGLSLLEQQCIV